jgi:hypothetical protein
MVRLVVFLVSVCLDAFRAIRRSREELVLENLALRQQVAALLRQRPRPALDDVDRGFWVALLRSWPKWVNALLIEWNWNIACSPGPGKLFGSMMRA